MTTKAKLLKALLILVLFFGVLIFLLPLYWMISTSLKPVSDIFAYPPRWIPSVLEIENYIKAFDAAPWGIYFLNTILYTFCIVTGVLITSVLSGYAFSKLNWKGRDNVFLLYIGTMMIPGQVTIIPVFMILTSFGWIDTYSGLIIPGLTSAFGCFLMRQFMMGLPNELIESALIDGAGHYKIVLKIIIPLVKPSLATLGIFSFMGAWNNFFWPLIVTNSTEMRTVQVGLSSFQGQYGNVEWGAMMAAATMVSAPVLIMFFLAQRYFIEGIAMSGIKG